MKKILQTLLWILILFLLPQIAFAVPSYEDIDGTVYHPLESQVLELGGKLTINNTDFLIECPKGTIKFSKIPAVIVELNGEEKFLSHGIFQIKAAGNTITYAPDSFYTLAGFAKPDPDNIVSYNANNEISVYLNSNKLSFDVSPVLENGRVLVPMRKIFESIGADVKWINEEQKVIGNLKNKEVSLTINSKNAYVNGTLKELDVPAKIHQGRTLIPLRFIGESLGSKVEWDETTKSVFISNC